MTAPTDLPPSGPTFDPGFSTPALTRLLSPASHVRTMCRVEAALARASATAGIVPGDVAERIAAACEEDIEDPEVLLRQGWESGTPVIPLLERLRDRLGEDAASWIHVGATSQDVLDTATMLQLREALQLICADLVELARHLRGLAVSHRDRPATAWTLLQEAVPTTVGRRVAGWLAPVVSHLQELTAFRMGLRVQLGGPTGTLERFGDRADDVVAAFAAELGLTVPLLPWHTDRSLVQAVVAALERCTRTVATIATDLTLLAHDGVVTMRAGGSSSMPDKRNPIDAVRAIAAAEACSGAASVVTSGRPHELERAAGGWHAEWFGLPLVLHTSAAAVEAVGRAVATLSLTDDEPGAGVATAAARAAVDRVVAVCDRELARW